MSWNTIKNSRWLEILSLVFISALVYLPNVGQFTYYKDDWYYMYDGLAAGPGVFVEMFRHLRPIRGPLFEFYFSLFGQQPLPYHLTLYFWRLVGGLGVLWLFHLLWPKNRHANFFMALMFLIYPGFLWWVAGIEYQPMVLSLCLQVFSIACTLKAVTSTSRGTKVLWTIGAILLGWGYLALVEYAIGMEAFRLLSVFILMRRKFNQQTIRKQLLETTRAYAIMLIIPMVFVSWRQLIFENVRKAADVGFQLGRLFASPLTGLWWFLRLFQSVLNVSLFAWGVPFYGNFFTSRLKDIFPGLLLTVVVIAIVIFADRFLKDSDDNNAPPTLSTAWQSEAVLIGIIGVVAGVLPIVVANRSVVFESFSHYALPASLAGVTFLAGLVYSIIPGKIRLFVLSTLIAIAALTHAAISTQAMNEEKMISDFWWQAVWRAPGIRAGTTLLVDYLGMSYGEGTDVVWGPANFVYYPKRQMSLPITLPLSAATDGPETIRNIQTGLEFDSLYYVHTTHLNYKNILMITKPSEASCLHAIDARWPELSLSDRALTIAASPASKIDNIIPDAKAPVLPAYLFGAEPAHDWCYFYQKASLARQQGDWEEIARLGHEVEKLGYHPNDQIEWMPFLQAYALLGNQKELKDISTRINTEKFYKKQACEILRTMPKYGYTLQPGMIRFADELFCSGK